MTALARALERAGFKRHQLRAALTAKEFIAAGGTLQEWQDVFRETAKRVCAAAPLAALKVVTAAPEVVAKIQADTDRKTEAAWAKFTIKAKAWMDEYTNIVDKAQRFDRVVELLDQVRVGGKMLGDCTSADLLRAAVAMESEARVLLAHASFYRQLAAIVAPGLTVRQHKDRADVVQLLTTTFKDEPT